MKVCIFAGTNLGVNEVYASAARELGDILIDNGAELVFGGSSSGLMGEVAGRFLSRGRHVTGIITHELIKMGEDHPHLKDKIVVDAMFERKKIMRELSDAIITLPGGFGTFDELFEVLTLDQLDLLKKPVGMLNVSGYYDALIGFLDFCVSEGFLKEPHRELLIVENEPQKLVDRIMERTAARR